LKLDEEPKEAAEADPGQGRPELLQAAAGFRLRKT
jgi:hypothetical protein